MALYAVSDLHGHYDVFIRGLEEIGFNDKDELYVIGDVIDRGPDGIALLEYIKNHKNMTLILGNHEVMMLGSVDPDGADDCPGEHTLIWLLYNGGKVTYDHYLELPEEERRSLLMWLSRCYVIKTLTLDDRKICLTHSYFHEDLVNKAYFESDPEIVWDVVWTSLFREDDNTRGENIYEDLDFEFITGHVPVQKARIRHAKEDDFNFLSMYRYENLIDIDGGCALGAVDGINNGAIFLRLDDMKEFPISFTGQQA